MIRRDLIRRAERIDVPSTALAAIVELRRILGELELKAIRNARRKGKTWTEIAADLGVSRQAVHQRASARVKR